MKPQPPTNKRMHTSLQEKSWRSKPLQSLDTQTKSQKIQSGGGRCLCNDIPSERQTPKSELRSILHTDKWEDETERKNNAPKKLPHSPNLKLKRPKNKERNPFLLWRNRSTSFMNIYGGCDQACWQKKIEVSTWKQSTNYSSCCHSKVCLPLQSILISWNSLS